MWEAKFCIHTKQHQSFYIVPKLPNCPWMLYPADKIFKRALKAYCELFHSLKVGRVHVEVGYLLAKYKVTEH
jgi:hypothetical protein